MLFSSAQSASISAALEITNLQLLCADCNQGKGHRDQTNWRSN